MFEQDNNVFGFKKIIFTNNQLFSYYLPFIFVNRLITSLSCSAIFFFPSAKDDLYIHLGILHYTDFLPLALSLCMCTSNKKAGVTANLKDKL